VLDAVVTVVDAKHVWEHLSVTPKGEVALVGREEVANQIAYVGSRCARRATALCALSSLMASPDKPSSVTLVVTAPSFIGAGTLTASS